MYDNSIVDSFDKYFYLTRATTAETRELVFRIRYHVYCREFQFEREEDCPGQMERDAYDAQSEHCLLVHKPTMTPMGCVRLILPDLDGQASMPFERFCRSQFSLSPSRFPPPPDFRPLSDKVARRSIIPSLRRVHGISLSTLPRHSFCEVSRLAVLSSFRRRKSDEKKPISFPDPYDDSRSSFPLIPLSLFLASLSRFLNSELGYAFAMMEPRLARLLKRFGLIFTMVGDVVDYHGQRGPFIYTRRRAFDNLDPQVRALLELIDHQLGCDNRIRGARQDWPQAIASAPAR